jgi:hypothetical protein
VSRASLGAICASLGASAPSASGFAIITTDILLLDRFVMAHELDLRGSLRTGELTLPLADLLLTKLQVVNLNRKDLVDVLALLLDHGFGPGEISTERIFDVTRSDWGFEHTIHRTLATLREQIGEFGLATESASSTSRARMSWMPR